jgi:hypothetical protein
MASTYSSLKIQLMGTGENSGTWGTITNTNLGTALEEAITGSADVTFSNADVTLTLSDTNSSQIARNLRLNLTGSVAAEKNLVVPAIEKIYIVNNTLTFAITVKNATGTGIAVPAGTTTYLYNNGTNVVDGITHLTSLTLASALPITSGGTGTNSTTYANLQANVSGVLPVGNGGTGVNTSTGTGSTVLSISPALTGTPTAPTASAGTNTTQIATTAFALANGIPSGAIVMWSGSVASIPSGWLLCNGSSGTPDLRNRFVIGAGSTYGVGGTGGSADAIVVSHSHGASSSVSDPGHAHGYSNPNAGGGNNSYFVAPPGAGQGGFGVTNGAGTGISVSTSIAAAGSSGVNANLPPYYALAYIMKA